MVKENFSGTLVLLFIAARKRESSSSAKTGKKRMECAAMAVIERRWVAEQSFGDRVFGHWALETRPAQARLCWD